MQSCNQRERVTTYGRHLARATAGTAAKRPKRRPRGRGPKLTRKLDLLKKMRVCLACEREFLSDGPGNRRCPACKEDPMYTGMAVRRGTLAANGRHNPRGKIELEEDE
ncbi:MAG: hypothetical protein HQ592_07835 [Planctomycetes bacterium]|jgi:hypothetical protein|nr:hypothetical protein [Planctomycetota bacterium]